MPLFVVCKETKGSGLVMLALLLLAACSPCPDGPEALERVRMVEAERLSILYDQLEELYLERAAISEYHEYFGEPIPADFQDLRPRKISIMDGHIYMSFWFCMDNGIQYDVFGFDSGSDPQIVLSWGEPQINYEELVLWKRDANQAGESISARRSASHTDSSL